MSAKINVYRVIKGHIETLSYGDNNKNIRIFDIAIFYILPIFVAIGAGLYKTILTKEALTIIATVAVTFMALMFSVLILVLDRYQKLSSIKLSDISNTESVRLSILKELYYNISYSIIVSLALSFFSILSAIFDNHGWPSIILSAITIAIGINLTLTILMIIKRVYDIFNPMAPPTDKIYEEEEEDSNEDVDS